MATVKSMTLLSQALKLSTIHSPKFQQSVRGFCANSPISTDDLEVEEVTETSRQAKESTKNCVTLLGRVGQNSILVSGGYPHARFPLATHVNYVKKGTKEVVQKTDWHQVVVFQPWLRDLAMQYVTKGRRIMVDGRLSYLDRRDPETNQVVSRQATIVANEIIFLGPIIGTATESDTTGNE